MKQLILFAFTSALFSLSVKAQDTIAANPVGYLANTSQTIFLNPTFKDSEVSTRYKSPYTTSLIKDGAIILGGVGVTAFGTYLINNKKDLTLAELATKTRDKVPFFDRGNVGYYSLKADDASYVPFKASFVWPIVMVLINKNERQNAMQVLSLYLETMAVTGSLFTLSAGAIHRSRPLVYGPNSKADLGLRLDRNSQRSFYAGHTAATAAASFFTAKVFQDFNPDSKLKPVVWGVAAAVPALVGYYRYKAGMHFLSDNLLGYLMGAGAGILVPELHKNKKLTNMSFVPEVGPNYRGLAITYKF